MVVIRPIGIYVRVSRKGDREDDRFHSPREQSERASALARAKGYAVGPVFEDIDVSGATPPAERPAMSALLASIKAGELAGIAAYSLDRLSREPAHGDALVKEVTRAGGVLLTPDIPDAIDTPTGEFTFGMLLQVAKLYRSQASARFASAKERAIAAGIPVTNRDAVGYRRDPTTRRYVPDPAVALVIRELFERRAGGAGRVELAELLESHGIQTSMGADTWSRQAVDQMIKSRTYLGEIRSGPYVNPNAHEPIVDEPTWLAAQNPNPRTPPKKPNQRYLLAGILRCKTCGYSMQGTKSGRGKPMYRCVRRHAGGICPEPARIEAAVVEAAVVEALFERANLIWEKRAARSPDVTPLEEALTRTEARLAQVMTDEARDALGELWAADVKARRLARDEAATALGAARASVTEGDVERRVGLIRHWRDEVGMEALGEPSTDPVVFIDPELKRQLIAETFPAISVARDKTLDFGPDTSGLSRRGYRRRPRLNPL